jgi:transcriptional regulator with XRE-family HTH domain
MTYSDLADVLERLPTLLRQERAARRLSMRAAAAQIGVSQPTISHVEAGDGASLWTAVAVLRWLDARPGPPDPPKETL